MQENFQAKLFDDPKETAPNVTGRAMAVLVPYPVDKAYDYIDKNWDAKEETD